jgi:hypothetical protein
LFRILKKKIQKKKKKKFKFADLCFRFDAVFGPKASNEDVFSHVVECVDGLLSGQNATVFAYGQTGGGKTHTMAGTKQDKGVIGRVVDYLFSRLTAGAATTEAKVEVSYLEIYNEKVFDLLEPKDADLQIREDLNRTIFVQNLSHKTVRSAKEFEAVYELGLAHRRSSPTALNATSSRSHAVLSIVVRCKNDRVATVGKLHLCDLAGSEDNRLTGNTGMRMTESRFVACVFFFFLFWLGFCSF